MAGVQREGARAQTEAGGGKFKEGESSGAQVPDEDDVGTITTGVVEEEMSREKMQIMKARTMYEMVEEIDMGTGTCKLLFLSNVQAQMIGSSRDAMQKMLNVLDVNSPKLVINLLLSYFDLTPRIYVDCDPNAGPHFSSGIFCGVAAKPPFVSRAEHDDALSKLDIFMSETLLPLAAQTNAVIICYAVQSCALASSLMRVYGLQRAKWGNNPPFTIICAAPYMPALYQNFDEDAHWKQIRKASKTWRSRDKELLELVWKTHSNADGHPDEVRLDLHQSATHYLLFDMIENKKRASFDGSARNYMMNELTRYLSSMVPTVAIKTGFEAFATYAEGPTYADTLHIGLNFLQSGSPLLFLDVRERPSATEKVDRDALIQEAKAKYEEHCDNYLKHGVADNFRTCAVAHFHKVLFSDGNPTGVMFGRNALAIAKSKSRVPLHEAIRIASAAIDGDEEGTSEAYYTGLQPATSQQIASLAIWLADRTARDGWSVLPDWFKREKESAGITYEEFYQERAHAMTQYCREIWTSPNFVAGNLCDQRGVNKLVSQLVRLDRLPKTNPLEGLLLLRSAWAEYDIAMHLADRYKLISKVLFGFQLLMGWLVVVSTTLDGAPFAAILGEGYTDSPDAFMDLQDRATFAEVAFVLSAFSAVLVSVDSLFNAKSRWRQLRSSAGALESLIWCYRTRVGDFEITSAVSRQSENSFRDVLVAWREQLVSGGDLQTSSLAKKYSSGIYQHQQFPDCPQVVEGDDFYGPVQPKRYVEMRIQPWIEFYRARIPIYTNSRYRLKFVLLLCSLLATLLTRYRLSLWVITITSGAAAITSWQEFADTARKTERYTRAAYGLSNLVSWWDSLSEVEKASRLNITELVQTGEAILSDERSSWVSTSSKARPASKRSDSLGDSSGSDQDGDGNAASPGNKVAPSP